MPMPVSVTEISAVEQDLLDLALIRVNLAEALVDVRRQRDVAPRGPLVHEHQRVVDRGRQIERSDVELHPSRFDLRQIEDVVDQRQEMVTRVEDVAEIFRLLLVRIAEHPLQEHVREADDCVERRAQLVRHAREKLGLVLARHREGFRASPGSLRPTPMSPIATLSRSRGTCTLLRMPPARNRWRASSEMLGSVSTSGMCMMRRSRMARAAGLPGASGRGNS